jgi:pimeloyl-ACP methyl ester carboxylesterase
MIQGHTAAQAPAWFRGALAAKPESGWVNVAGARLEWAAWGKKGRPGLLLMTGNGAHIGWWRPIAPLLAEEYRVATFSWTGMGRSDWRKTYETETLMKEPIAVAEATGLFDGDIAPFLCAHSFGGFIALNMLIREGERFSGGVLLDSRLRIRQNWGPQAKEVPPFHVHATKGQALARFKLKPDQPHLHPFILDMLAEESLERVGQGWRYRQDPNMRRKTPLSADLIPSISDAKCPLAFIRGAGSASVADEIWAEQKAAAPPGTPFVEIPAAYHHVMHDQPIALIAAMRALLQSFPGEHR